VFVIKKKVPYFLIVIIVFCFSTFKVEAQSRIDSLQKIKELIIKESTVSGEGLGLFFAPSKYWYAFGYLVFLAKNEELKTMTSDSNSAVRIYAYLGLLYNDFSEIKSIKKRLLKDKEMVNTFFGCISGRDMTVASCIKYYLKGYYRPISINYLQKSLRNDTQYGSQLYDSLLNDKKIKTYSIL
jgi:hypothetical protein